jgi:Flp pilus assembly protein TadG
MILHPMRRSGAVITETALILPLFLLLIFGMFDIGVGILRSQSLSQTARTAARIAIVHGDLAPNALGAWGPNTYGPTALSDSGPIATAVRSSLAGIDPLTVFLTIEWIDGSNHEENRVRVTLTHSYQPVTGYVIQTNLELRASSTMYITH